MISVGIWGNNLNQGYFLAELFRELGARAKVFVVESALAQDRHAWWTTRPADNSLLEPVATVPPLGAPGPLLGQAGVSRLYQCARAFDVLLLREEGPALFSELPGVPRVFAAQGADLQLWPFWMEVYYSPTAIWRQLRAAARSGLTTAARRTVGLTRSWASLRRTQGRQRQGISACARAIVFPYQRPLLARLRFPPERTRYVPVPGMPPRVVGGEDSIDTPSIDPALLRGLAQLRTLFLHPTRQFFLQEDGNRFLKDNDKLLHAFARFVGRAPGSTRLALVEKGRSRDLATAKALVHALGLSPHVVWLPELPNHELRNLLRLPNVVVCDQFSPHVNALGNLGRESAYFGVPLITSYDGADDPMYSRRPPHVLLGNSIDTLHGALVAAAQLDSPARERLRDDCAAWYQDNLDPLRNASRYLDACREAAAEGRVGSV